MFFIEKNSLKKKNPASIGLATIYQMKGVHFIKGKELNPFIKAFGGNKLPISKLIYVYKSISISLTELKLI